MSDASRYVPIRHYYDAELPLMMPLLPMMIISPPSPPITPMIRWLSLAIQIAFPRYFRHATPMPPLIDDITP